MPYTALFKTEKDVTKISKIIRTDKNGFVTTIKTNVKIEEIGIIMKDAIKERKDVRDQNLKAQYA